METVQQRLAKELIVLVVTRLREEKLGLYPALHIMSDVLGGVAEACDLEGENDDK